MIMRMYMKSGRNDELPDIFYYQTGKSNFWTSYWFFMKQYKINKKIKLGRMMINLVL